MHSEDVIRTVTAKGQVTIPVEVRRLLKVEPQSQIIFRITDGKVELLPVPMTLEQAFGSVKPRKRPEDWAEIDAVAAQERAERWAKSLKE